MQKEGKLPYFPNWLWMEMMQCTLIVSSVKRSDAE